MSATIDMGHSALTPYEVDVLEMLAGERDLPWGGWVAGCLEFLSGRGYCTRGPTYRITATGRLALEAMKATRH